MTDDLPDQISQLETEIERLAGVTEACRKIILIARAAILIGVLMLAITIFGLIQFDQFITVGSIAALVGGIVVAGSNVATLRQVTAEMRTTVSRRSELIGQLEFSVVIQGTEML
jgi:hypothetical protein